MLIHLSEDLEIYLREQLRTGRFASESEVISMALRQMRDRGRKRAEVQRAMLEHDPLEPVGRS